MKSVKNRFILVKQESEETEGFSMSPTQQANEQYQYGNIVDLSEEAESFKLSVGDRIIFSRSRASGITTEEYGRVLIIRSDDVVSVV